MKLITNLLLIVCFLFLGLHCTQAQCDGTNDIIQNSTNSEVSTSSIQNVGMGNSFTATCSGTLEGVSFWTSRTSSGTIGGISVTIELYRNPFSSGRELLSSVTTDTPFQNPGTLERYFAFDNAPSLVSGAVYGVRMIVNDSNRFIEMQFHTGNRYAGGNMFVNNFNQSSPWSTRDLRFQIHYEDNVAPDARCRNITRALGPDGTVSITANNINNNSTDADSGTGFLGLSQSTFTCDDLGENTVTLFVRDQENNLGTCQATVTITDGADPIITCPADITVFTNPGLPVAVDYITMYDDCSFAAPEDFTFLGRWEDKYFYLSDNPIQINQAFAEAELLGGHVATILDDAHNSFIRTAVDDALGTTNEQVLIGYNDVAVEDTFVWHDGNTTATYTNWSAAQPNNAGGNEDYTVINSGSVARWNDVSGSLSRRYILQLSPTLTQTSGFASGDFFPIGTTTNTFEATDAFGNASSCSFDVTVIESPYETSVELSNGKLTITDIETDSDDQIILSNDGTILTISNLVVPNVSGGPTLQDQTTVTVSLSSITNGIEFIAGNGDNAITFANDLTLSGVNNNVTLQNINNYTQSGIINIGGSYTITGNATAAIVLKEVTAAGLSVTGVQSIDDSGLRLVPIIITGTTVLEATGTINIDDSDHRFSGSVSLEGSRINFVVFGDTTFNNVMATDASFGVNTLRVRSGEMRLTGNIQTAGASQLQLYSFGAIQQPSGSITTDVLTLRGRSNGITSAFFNATTNNIRLLETSDDGNFFNTLRFSDVDNFEVGRLNASEFDLTANTITLTEDTNITMNGTGTSSFNGNIDITTNSILNPVTINHDAGTIDFNGANINLDRPLDYNGSTNGTTNFNGTTIFNTGGITPIFGTINSTGIFTVNVFTNVLNEARFSGATAVLKGRGSLAGAPTIIENDATLTPGEIGNVTSLTVNDLSISSATFAPVIEDDDDYDVLEVQGTITLNNATLNPITGTGTFGNIPIVLIDNDGLDAIVGTFNGYPEGSPISFGNFAGIISYVGGDGNDVVLQLTETTVELSAGKLTITDVNGGTSDDQISFANDGTTLTISNVTAPFGITGVVTRVDATTFTVPLANITNGIEFVSEAGSNSVTITNDLTLPGTTNNLKLNNLGGYTQTGAINIGGDLELIGDGNVIFNLTEITAASLTISNNAGITDSSDSIVISGTTSLSSSERILIDEGQGNHQFSGIVTIDAKDVFFTNSIDTTFGTISIAEPVDGEPNFINFLSAVPGAIDFSDTVSIPGTDTIDTNLFVYSIENITQSGGTITTDFLILYGTGNTVATLTNDNAIRAIAAENPIDTNNVGLASVTVKSTEAVALEKIFVDEFNITAPIMRTFPDFTVINKNGTGESSLNGSFFVQNGSTGTGTTIVNHNAGTINFNGDVNDFLERITYNGASGTITNINGTNIDFPNAGPDRGFTFGFLNVNGNINIGNIAINILNTATFTGANTLMTGPGPLLSGGNTIITDNAIITPGAGTTGTAYSFSSLEMTSGATFAPFIQGLAGSNRDQLEVDGLVTLNNAVFAPTGGFTIQAGEEVILIDNVGIDPVVGTFNNLPESAVVSFGDFTGMITYVGGDGNDVSLVPDTINPTAICQDLNFTIGLDGITINATQVDNGSSDNAGIESLLINGEASLDFTYDDLGVNSVTFTVTDPSGNTAECMATITLTSNVTFPILISEYQPKPVVSNPTQNIEIKGEPGEGFLGVFVVIENDSDSGNVGLVLSADTISGTFNSDGLLTASIPDIADPSHTIVLTTSFSGTVGVTNVSTGSNVDHNTVDLSTFGIILDAVGVGDGGACCPVDTTLGAAFGGVDVPSIGTIPAAIFRSASTGDFYQLNSNGAIYNANGAIVDASIFDTTPTNDGTFGQINPMISLNMDQSAFITTWKTDNIGDSGDDQIRIFTDINETYNYAVDWGDGTLDTGVTSDIVHTYSAPGTYTIKIAGTFPKFESNSSFGGDALKLLSIDQWGDIAWTSFEDSFDECKNMDMLATDVPDLSNVTSLDGMFSECNALVGNATFNTWDVSTIQNMKGMFAFCHAFNQPLNNWNVSNVTNMDSMFNRATIFNQDLNSWNTSQVQSMNFMFNMTSDFNGQIDNWNVSNVTEMIHMFNEAEAFNGDISSWNTAQVTAMNSMFQNALNFNQNISGWNVANVDNMSFMFKGATNFNQDLSNWDVSNVTTADLMLSGTAFSAANYDLLLLNWNQLTLQDNVNFGTDAGFCVGETAKQSISTNHNWNFTDGGQNCSDLFITKWKTDNTGVSADNQITIPTNGTGYDYIVDWGDGTVETAITGDATHTYATVGTYTVRIIGDFPRIYFNSGGDALKITEVAQWGSNPWTTMEAAFRGCQNLVISAIDAPNLSNVTNMATMLRDVAVNNNAIDLWEDISHWDVSNVNIMTGLFRGTPFNQNIAAWDVSNVTNMASMFRGTPFNQDISGWNVSNVTTLSLMFYLAADFNQDLSPWDVSKVGNMARVFWNSNFNQDLSAWDISSVTTMVDMFRNAPLSTENYDNTLIGWATLNTAAGETQIPLNITLGATGIQYCEAEFERQELILTYGWTITNDEKAADCNNYFITNWETTSDNESITIPTTGTGYNYFVDWGDGTVAIGFNGDATHTYATAGTYTVSILGDFPRIYFNLAGDFTKIREVVQWGSNTWTSMELAFAGCDNLNVTATDTPDLSQVTNTFGMFAFGGNLVGNASFNSWDVSNVENMGALFFGCFNFNQPLTNWNVSAATSMVSMFSEADIYNQPLDSWNVSNVTDMRFMFRGADEFNQPLANWNVSNVETMESMFEQATDFNQPLDSWNVSNVVNMEGMFLDAINFDQPLNNWNMSTVEITTNMFLRAENFNQPLNNWNVSNVINMELMFGGAVTFNQDISSWDVSNVTTLQLMFFEATAFDQDLGSWDISNLTGINTMFTNAGMSTDNYDSTLIGWATLDTGETQIPTGITFNGGSSQYCLSETERQSLIDTYGWTIDDGGLSINCGDVVLEVKVCLQGAALNPNVGEENLMRDDLRVAGMIPTRSPYADMLTCEQTVLDVAGPDAIVDWVWVELMEEFDPMMPTPPPGLPTAQSALLQRDGDIVAVDGISPVSFDVNAGNYKIVIKHRNHLGIMSANTIALSSTTTTVDFTDGSTPTFGSNAQTTFGMPAGVTAMWTGNVNGDAIVQYSGTDPDTPEILSTVLNDPGNFLNFPTYAVSGYLSDDLNMDGNTQYSGTNPDTPIILQNVLSHPGNFLNFSTYQIIEQLPNTN